MSYRIRQRTVSDFTQWAADLHLLPASADAEKQWRQRIAILLDGRADFLNKPDPTLWKSGDVHELLMVHVVTRQFDTWDLAERAPSAVREFLCFLDQTGRLHPASTRVRTLLKELDRLAPNFPAAMADSSRWRLAKRVFTAMVSDGVQLEDEAEVDCWAEQFSARGPAERRGVLGELMDSEPGYGAAKLLVHEGQVALLEPGTPVSKHMVWRDAPCDCPDHGGEYPPVALPGKAELAQMVPGYGSGVLRRLVEFGRWAGDDGRPVDKRGELARDSLRAAAAALDLPSDGISRPYDLPALAKLWRLSLDFGVLALRRTRVIAGPGLHLAEQVLRGDAEPGEALTLWAGLYDELLFPDPAPAAVESTEAVGDWLQIWPPRIFGLLYRLGPDSDWAQLDDVTAQLLDDYAHLIPPADSAVFTELASLAARQPLADLAEHGAVEISPPPAELQERFPVPAREGARKLGTQLWTLFPLPGIRIRLTDLGRYVARERLLAEGARVPLAEPGALALQLATPGGSASATAGNAA